ncbi:MAG: low-specificity L-threonine aldolase [Myxococcales bacterium]|nr:low-specificity L-threonine aldolase [Myxococcales bacterium]
MPHIVDLRSDTVTRPTAAMRAVMAAAPVGDDVFDDDPSVHFLQDKVAELLGKESALFVPSGTMANQLAVRAHCRPGDEAVLHARSHVFNYEGGAAAALSGVTLRPIDSMDGSLGAAAVAAALHLGDDPHLAPTRLIAYENTHNGCGGVVLDPVDVDAVCALARRHGLGLHLDGARLYNAAIASGTSIAALAAPFDTVSLCLSKGLGAPVGSLLAGDRGRIAHARRWRKAMGGGMRQAGILAAAGTYALDHHVERLADDHARARRFAASIATIDGLRVDVGQVQTNLVYFDVDPASPAVRRWSADVGAMRVVLAARLRERGVWIAGTAARLRAVFHLDVDDGGLERALAALRDAVG